MKNFLRVLGGSLFVGLLVLAYMTSTMAAGASPARTNPVPLPRSPISTSTLVAQAIHAGKIHLPRGTVHVPTNPDLTCTPAPCALPNVLASEGNTGNPDNEVPIVVSHLNQKDLLTGANDYNCPTIQGFFNSSDGGKTWTHTCLAAFSGGFGEGDPGVGYDLLGNAYITGIDAGTPDGSDIVFEKSSNNGGTWSAPAVAVKPFFPGGLTDKDWLQVDTSPSSHHVNALYISVTQFDSSSNSTITVSHSTDGGSTWKEVQVDTEQFFPMVDQFSDIAIARDGTVYVTWMRCLANGPTGDCGGTVATLEISKSTDGGNTWSAPTAIETPNLAPDTCGAFYGCLPNTFERVSEIPAIDADRSIGPNAGNLYVVDYNWTGSFMQVLVTRSTNGGTTWSSAIPVAPSSDTHDQFFPWLTTSRHGNVGVTWLDRRNDPSNVSYEAFGTVSTNGGTSFITDIQIASVPSNPFNDGFGSGFMGDYSGNYWIENKLYASWSDTRNGSDCQDEVGGLKLI